MGKRKITILEPAATAVAEIAWFIENKGLPSTAKQFVNDAFDFFEKLSDQRIDYRPCSYAKWKGLDLPVHYVQKEVCDSLCKLSHRNSHLRLRFFQIGSIAFANSYSPFIKGSGL